MAIQMAWTADVDEMEEIGRLAEGKDLTEVVIETIRQIMESHDRNPPALEFEVRRAIKNSIGVIRSRRTRP